MGSLGTPTLLLEKGADEHDFQLRPSQMQAIADAQTIIWIGPELTPWLDRAMADTSALSLPLLALPATQTQDFPEGGLDPHAWLNPANAAIWTDAIAADLSALDPENAATYSANATAAKAKLAALDADLKAQLEPIKAKPFVTFHAAYGYFTAHFGLTQAASLALGDATSPGAAKLAELQTQLQSGTYTCAFPEVQHDPALLTQIMADTTAKLGQPLDPVGSSLPFGPDAYDTLLRSIAKSLTDCLNP
jgi:zinc transport system substrate-binding protein